MEKPIFIHKGDLTDSQKKELETLDVWLTEWSLLKDRGSDSEDFLAEYEAAPDDEKPASGDESSSAWERVRKVLDERFPYDLRPQVGEIRALAARYQADDISDRKVLIMSFSRDSMMVQVCPVSPIGVPCGNSEILVKSPSDAEQDYEEWVICLWDTKEMHYDQFAETWILDTLDAASMDQVWSGYGEQVAIQNTESQAAEGFFWPFNPIEQYQNEERAFYASIVEEAYELLGKDTAEVTEQVGEKVIAMISPDQEPIIYGAIGKINESLRSEQEDSSLAAAAGEEQKFVGSSYCSLSVIDRPELEINLISDRFEMIKLIIYHNNEKSNELEGWTVEVLERETLILQKVGRISNGMAALTKEFLSIKNAVICLLPPDETDPLFVATINE